MTTHELAGKSAPADMLTNVPRLITGYFSERPGPAEPSQRVAFGTLGHRSSALSASFNEAHIRLLGTDHPKRIQAGRRRELNVN